MKFLREISPCLILILLRASFALAGDATFFAGFQNPGKLARDVVVGEVSRAFSADAGGGVVGIRYSGSRPITFESGFSYGPKFLTTDQKSLQIHTNLLAQFPGHISPYGTVGIGLLSTWGGTSDNNGSAIPVVGPLFNFGTRFALNYGGGLKIRNMAGPLGLRFDVRGYSAPGVYGSTLNIVEISAGAMISW
jgi:hypothetical protein